MERKRLDDYIERAKQIHGDKYNYIKSDAPTCKDKTIFWNAQTKRALKNSTTYFSWIYLVFWGYCRNFAPNKMYK